MRNSLGERESLFLSIAAGEALLSILGRARNLLRQVHKYPVSYTYPLGNHLNH